MLQLPDTPATVVGTHRVTFVYLGQELPRYARASLHLAARTSGLYPELICSDSIADSIRVPDVDVIPISGFYNPSDFRAASSRIAYPVDFRGGLWHHSVERLFVLAQFMAFTKRPRLFHAELDQLLFRCDMLVSELDKRQTRDLLVPFHAPDRAVASVLYCGDLEALHSLTEYATSIAAFRNEMELIASWSKGHTDSVRALPTLYHLLHGSEAVLPVGVSALDVQELGGVVDAAQLGQWVGGVDPRNVPFPKAPATKFVDAEEAGLLSAQDLKGLRFDLAADTGELNCTSPGSGMVRIYNLHLHSKVHAALVRHGPALARLIADANLVRPSRIPGTRSTQIRARGKESITKAVSNPQRVVSELQRRANVALGRRPSSAPLLSGDTFRAIATHVWESSRKAVRSERLRPGDVVFCESHLLEEFTESVVAKKPVPLVILAGNSDRNFDTDPIFKMRQDCGLRIFAQNLTRDLDGYRPLPIGLENAWMANNGRRRPFDHRVAEALPRRSRILSAFSPQTNPALRLTAIRALRTVTTVDEPGQLTPHQHRRALRSYMFVASPPGNGEDTHRAWEAMYLGCVPIVLESHLTREFEVLGLPLWVVSSYEELDAMTESDLQAKYVSLRSRFDSPALQVEYWHMEIMRMQQIMTKQR